MITNNASFNCIATKMIVTSRNWPQRQQFLDKIEAVLARIPAAAPIIPAPRSASQNSQGASPRPGLRGRFPGPWSATSASSVIRTISRRVVRLRLCRDGARCFERRRVCRLRAAFVNDRLWGNLGAGIMVHPKFRARQATRIDFRNWSRGFALARSALITGPRLATP